MPASIEHNKKCQKIRGILAMGSAGMDLLDPEPAPQPSLDGIGPDSGLLTIPALFFGCPHEQRDCKYSGGYPASSYPAGVQSILWASIHLSSWETMEECTTGVKSNSWRDQYGRDMFDCRWDRRKHHVLLLQVYMAFLLSALLPAVIPLLVTPVDSWGDSVSPGAVVICMDSHTVGVMLPAFMLHLQAS